MKSFRLFVGIVIYSTLGILQLAGQNGDQILDGIGETGLIARYIFKGDVKDWSRNNLHAVIRGTDYIFTEDELFGKVLSFQGGSETYILIPGESVTGEESLSITGWIWLHTSQSGQLFFDFGKNATFHFFTAPHGTSEKEGYQTQIINKSYKKMAGSPSVDVNRWNHLAVVLNVPSNEAVA
jgi:uncharacterized protein